MLTITGATGKLGRLVIDDLLARGVPADQIAAAVRSPASAADLADRGVVVREADYERPDTLPGALAGTERLLLISSSEVGRRIRQHRNVIDAAAASGVRHVAYTSVLNADVSQIQLASEHLATEQALAQAGIPFTLLRHGWYLENYTDSLAATLQHGAVLGGAGEGRVAAATRADFAQAAAAVLTTGGHEGAVYELGNDTPFTLAELAQAITDASDVPVTYQDLPPSDYAKALITAGIPQPVAETLADSDLGIGRGDLTTDRHDLSTLLGAPTAAMPAAVSTALAALA